MKHITITTLTKDRGRIMELLQKQGVVEIIAHDESAHQEEVEAVAMQTNTQKRDTGYWLAQTTFALNFLRPFAQEKKSVLQKLLHPKIEVSSKEITDVLANFPYQDITIRCEQYEAERNTILNTLKSMHERTTLLTRWRDLTFPPNSTTRSATTLTGTMPHTALSKLKAVLNEKNLPYHFVTVNKNEKEMLCVVLFQTRHVEALTSTLTSFGFKQTVFSDGDEQAIPRERIRELQKKEKELVQQLQRNSQEVQKLAQELSKLHIVSDVLRWEYEQQQECHKLIYTDHTLTLTGWVPEKSLSHLERALERITKKAFSLTARVPKEDEEVPSVLDNKKFAQPFETITDMYGAPFRSDPDPTIFLIPFFVVFFALALTDAGYGILIAISTFLALKFLPLTKSSRKLTQLLMICGIATIVMGGLFGSWFGITLDVLPERITSLFQTIQLIDPVADPNTFLLLVFGLGVIQVLTGIAVKFWWKWKTIAPKEALLDEGMWLVFLTVLLAYGAAQQGIAPSLLVPTKWGALALTGALIASQGRKIKNPFGKVGMGVLSLYNVVGYFSDVLSYSRLVALGLATGIIATVVNLVATLFRDMIPYIGWIVYIVILVGGHLFNLAINSLGAFIHTARLHFVEYFPKFLEGAGKKFEPFTQEAQYISIQKPE